MHICNYLLYYDKVVLLQCIDTDSRQFTAIRLRMCTWVEGGEVVPVKF